MHHDPLWNPIPHLNNYPSNCVINLHIKLQFHSLDIMSLPANGCWFRSTLHELGVCYSKLGNLPSANIVTMHSLRTAQTFEHKDIKIVQETTITMDSWYDRARMNQHAPMMDDK